MNQQLYYTAPSQEVFDDIKLVATRIWCSYDDTHGYVTGKLDRIKDLPNVKDNWIYMVAMFDPINTSKLLRLVRPETAALIRQAVDYE